MSKFSLAWDAHNQNLCNGLTALQQNGEFVDMTLAADGHHVKVHQMVISLASPYLKDIITSVETPHPVIFLTKVSYSILSAILEYIYTGEVLIDKDSLEELIEAAQELHIKGLQDMKLELQEPELISKPTVSKSSQDQLLSGNKSKRKNQPNDVSESEAQHSYDDETTHFETIGEGMEVETDIEDMDERRTGEIQAVKKKKVPGAGAIQYTVSNQGVLQMVLNRYLYYLRYTSRQGPSGHRKWRCIDCIKSNKCPASIVTKGDVIIKRYAAHNHPFHDKQILRKVRDGAVYTAIHEAEVYGQNIKLSREKLNSSKSIS